jgi:hypothetical protein
MHEPIDHYPREKHMKKTAIKIVAGAGLAAAAAGLATAAPASAEPFITCPDGRTGVATTVTSCEFAHNVRTAWFTQPGPVVQAFSPVTDQIYDMQCESGFTADLSNGAVVDSARCVGGDNAVVVVW